MPLYQYHCAVCNHDFDKIVSAYDTDRQEPCPDCGEPASFTMPQGSRNGVRFQFNFMAES